MVESKVGVELGERGEEKRGERESSRALFEVGCGVLVGGEEGAIRPSLLEGQQSGGVLAGRWARPNRSRLGRLRD